MNARHTTLGKVSHISDLALWQLARKLAPEVYRMTRRVSMARDFAIIGQVCESLISISSNIAEGFENEGNREFLQFLSISKGSCGLAADQQYISAGELRALQDLIRRISAMIGSLSIHLRKSGVRSQEAGVRSQEAGVRNTGIQEYRNTESSNAERGT